jgi:hypothetical protein
LSQGLSRPIFVSEVTKANAVIRYTLTCDKDHHFESWFQSSAAFDALAEAGHLSCAICGSPQIRRALMTPSVPNKGDNSDKTQNDAPTALSAPNTELAALRKHLEESSDYVGMSFAKEARKMHDGEAPERAIYGEAKLDEAKKLIEDGIPVAPLPFLPKRKAN